MVNSLRFTLLKSLVKEFELVREEVQSYHLWVFEQSAVLPSKSQAIRAINDLLNVYLKVLCLLISSPTFRILNVWWLRVIQKAISNPRDSIDLFFIINTWIKQGRCLNSTSAFTHPQLLSWCPCLHRICEACSVSSRNPQLAWFDHWRLSVFC